jgi:putative SOS response-associated peptidase YedK
MCGRFTLHNCGEVVAEAFGLPEVPQLQPRFNITPSQSVAVVRSGNGQSGRELVFLRWGLIQAWADDPSIGNRMANARSECQISSRSEPFFSQPSATTEVVDCNDCVIEWP